MHCLLPRPRRLITDRVWDRRSRARSRAAVGTALSSGRSLVSLIWQIRHCSAITREIPPRALRTDIVSPAIAPCS